MSGGERVSERTLIAAWLRQKALDMPDRSFWWAMLHPYQFARHYGEFFTLLRCADAIERGEHIIELHQAINKDQHNDQN